jgi:hypothetical protein
MVKTQQTRNQETLERLNAKTQATAFINYIHKNTNLSRIEASVVFDEFSKQFLEQNDHLQPMQTFIMATKINAKHGKKLTESDFQKVIITLHTAKDDSIRQDPKEFCTQYNFGSLDPTTALRRYKLHRITYEVYKQNCVLTEDDLAYTIFNCGLRTIQRDIDAFKKADVFIPIRGTVCDIGRSISHKIQAVKQFLGGKEVGEIARRINHSHNSIDRYIKKFIQVCVAIEHGLKDPEISMLTESSYSLINEYKNIYKQAQKENKLDIIKNLMSSAKIPAKKSKKGGVL